MSDDYRTAGATLNNDREHVFHSWSAQAEIAPVAIAASTLRRKVLTRDLRARLRIVRFSV